MNKLVEFVEEYKKNNPSGWRKVVYGVAAGIAAFVVLLAFFIRETLRQREIARLNQEIAVLQQDAQQQETNAALTALECDKTQHTEAANKAIQRANELKNELEGLKNQHEANVAIINSIKSWSDVDARVR